jgi:hypothetical protein
MSMGEWELYCSSVGFFSWLPWVALSVLAPAVAFYSTRLLRSHCVPGPDRWPQGSWILYHGGTLARNIQWWCWCPDECHVTSLHQITPMCDIIWVDGSPGIVAALLRHGIRSPRAVACLLCMSSRSVPYCHRPTTLISCTPLMPAIRCVWPVTYAFNALPTARA